MPGVAKLFIRSIPIALTLFVLLYVLFHQYFDGSVTVSFQVPESSHLTPTLTPLSTKTTLLTKATLSTKTTLTLSTSPSPSVTTTLTFPSVAPEWAWFGSDCSGLGLGTFRTDVIPPAVIANASLPQPVIAGVKCFTFFVGFGRSGSTLVGALLDAHPNIVLGTDYQLFLKWPQWRSSHRDISYLYTALYQFSIKFANFFRTNKGKGYTFNMKKGYNGRYNKSILVIGEKEAGTPTTQYINEHQQWMRTFKELQDTVKVPIKVVQVLRNPVDTISTEVVYKTLGETNRLNKSHVQIHNSNLLDDKIHSVMCRYEAVHHMLNNPNISMEFHQLHLADITRDPHGEMRKLCTFFDVECFDWYMDASASLVRKTLSKSRNEVFWSEDQIRRVEDAMRRIPFLSHYRFSGED